MNENALKTLWESTRAFHERFGTNGGKVIESQLRVVSEEVFEFIYVATMAERSRIFQPEVDYGKLAWATTEEAADVIVTLFGVLQNLGVEYGDLAAAMYGVADKNDAKTHETHEINSAGKVARRKKDE